MVKQNHYNLQEETEKKFNRRERKKKTKMKVRGAGVKVLQGVIIRKQKI